MIRWDSCRGWGSSIKICKPKMTEGDNRPPQEKPKSARGPAKKLGTPVYEWS